MRNWQAYFQRLPFEIVGIGVTAFNRVMPAFFWPDYQVVCHKNGLDLVEIAKKCQVFSIERDCRQGIKRLNSLAILKHPQVQAYLKSLGSKVGIFLYKSTRRVEKVCYKNGWQIIGNQSEIRDPFENKKVFRETLAKVGIQPIEGEILKLVNFDEQVFLRLQKKYGQKLVLKLPEVTKGGGIGQTFVEKPKDLNKFWQKIKRLKKYYNLKFLIVERQLVDSLSPSITGCVTRFGVLTSVVQTQILDMAEVVNTKIGRGRFVGHDWSFRHYSEKIQKQAERICQRFGEYLYKKDYRGIFGIDLLIEKGSKKVYSCECNPRFTGAFPVYSMLQFKQNEPPFDVFHLLEHLNIDYQIDLAEIQKAYRQPKEGAQIILHNKTQNWLRVTGELKAGVYKLIDGKLVFLRPGFSMMDIKKQDEFVLTDGLPRRDTLIKPFLRILKILFPKKILTIEGDEINQETKLIVKKVYQSLALKRKR